LLGGANDLGSPRYKDGEGDKLGGDPGKLIDSPLSPSHFDHDGLALYPTELPKSLEERLAQLLELVATWGSGYKDTDPRDLRRRLRRADERRGEEAATLGGEEDSSVPSSCT
jgi:hypothetical protein